MGCKISKINETKFDEYETRIKRNETRRTETRNKKQKNKTRRRRKKKPKTKENETRRKEKRRGRIGEKKIPSSRCTSKEGEKFVQLHIRLRLGKRFAKRSGWMATEDMEEEEEGGGSGKWKKR